MTSAALNGHANHVLRALAERVRRLREERGLTPWTSAKAAPTMPEPPLEPLPAAPRHPSPTGAASQAVVRATKITWGGELPPAPWTTPPSHPAGTPVPETPSIRAVPRGEEHPHRHPVDAASPSIVIASEPAVSRRPRTFSDLREGALAGREFATLREFAIAAVVEGRFSAVAVARVFRLPSWRLEQWVAEARQPRR